VSEERAFLPSARRPKPGRPRKAEYGHVPGTSDAGGLDSGGPEIGTGACETTALPCSASTEKRQARRLRALQAVQPRLLDLAASAAYLNVSEWTVREMEWAGILRRVRVPLPSTDTRKLRQLASPTSDHRPAFRNWDGELRKILFDRADLDRLIDAWKA